MSSKPRRINVALVVLLGAYVTAAFLVLTRPGATLSGDDRTVVRIAHWQVEAGPREAMDALIERYEELNPDIRVQQLAVPGRVYKQWLRTQLIGGNATDIIEFGSFIGGVNDIPPRFFDPISRYVEEPNPYNKGTVLEGVRWRDTFIDGLDTPDTFIDKLSNYYAVTLCMVTMRLFYNPDLLEEITGGREVPKTYVELQALAKKVAAYSESNDRRISLYAGSEFNGVILMEQMLSRGAIGLSFEGDRYREQGLKAPEMALEFLRGNWDYRRPELLAGLQNMKEAARFMRPGFQQMERDSAMQEFLRGQSLMIVTGTWDATSLRTLAPFEVGVYYVPWPAMADQTEGGKYYWSPVSEGAGKTSMPFYLNKASRHKKEAIDFLHFVTSVEGNAIWVEKSGWLPSVRGVEVPDYAKVYLQRFEGFQMRSAFMRGFGGETREVWERQLYHLTSSQAEVEDFLSALEAEFPDALRRDVNIDLRNIYLSLRRDTPPLTALATLNRLEGHDAQREKSFRDRESSQNITEAKLYEALAVLEKGAAVSEPAP